MKDDESIDILNTLLASLNDARRVYTVAADNASSPELVAFFNLAATTRRELIDELSAGVRALGGRPSHLGTAGGLLSRAWIDVKGALTGRDDLAVLESCEAGEASTVRAYEHALEGDPPAAVREILRSQLSALLDSHARVRELVEEFRTARD